jgi:cytochrome c oxidase subunit IV
MSQHVIDRAPASEHAHPSNFFYVAIAIVLAIITSIEVAVYYVEALRPLLVPILLILSALKFVLVAAFFMHLKFDSKLFAYFFGGGLSLAAVVVISILVLTHLAHGYVKPAAPQGAEAAESAPATAEEGH